MESVKFTLAIVQVLTCIFLIAVILLQSAKNAGLSGVISGGAETFFGKGKAKSMDDKLSKATIVVAIVFAITTMAINII